MCADAEEVASVEEDLAAVRLVEPRDDVEERRLAGAVGPDQAADLAQLEVEGDSVERDDTPESP